VRGGGGEVVRLAGDSDREDEDFRGGETGRERGGENEFVQEGEEPGTALGEKVCCSASLPRLPAVIGKPCEVEPKVEPEPNSHSFNSSAPPPASSFSGFLSPNPFSASPFNPFTMRPLPFSPLLISLSTPTLLARGDLPLFNTVSLLEVRVAFSNFPPPPLLTPLGKLGVGDPDPISTPSLLSA
tara:strand:- start:585 stop:1136 length:552 start_codon:yes stop_codon:yes gene_type:complete